MKKAVVGETLLALLDTLEEGAELDMYDTVVAYLIDEQLAEDFDGANKIMGTLQPELIGEVYVQQIKCLVESEKVAQGAYKRAQELGAKRRRSSNPRGIGKSERAGYNLSQSARSRNASLETQGGNQTGGGSKSFGYAKNKSNPVKSKSTGDTGATGHYKKRDEKVTSKSGKTTRYKMKFADRMNSPVSKRQELKDPKKNPKHEANK